MSIKTTNARKDSNIFIKYMKIPIRFLTLARDLYVESITGSAAHHVTYGNTMGCPMPQIPTLPRSFSTTSSHGSTHEDDLRDLIKTASARKKELGRSKSTPIGGEGGGAPPVKRSNTVAIGRIDEENEFEYGGDNVGLLKPDTCPPSRIHGLSRILSKKV